MCGSQDSINLACGSILKGFHSWLAESCAKHETDIIVLTLMPDHIHAVLEGLTDDADVLGGVYLFKQRCGYWGKRLFPGLNLQKDFYDHIVRDNENLTKHICYVLNNPVRAGLATTWDEYPYSLVREDLRQQLTAG